MSERNLKWCLAISLILTALMAVALIVTATFLTQAGNPKCETPLCISAAHEILKSVDATADPCDDFFAFACGNSIRKNGKAKLDAIKDEIKGDLERFMEEKIREDDNYWVKKQKKLFQVCMNESEAEDEASLDVFQKLVSNLGGWPLLVGNGWNSNLFDWKEVTYKLRRHGLHYASFLEFEIDMDPTNTSRYVLHIREPFLTIPEEEHKTLYGNYMTATAITLGAERTLAKNEMAEVDEFTRKLHQVTIENDWSGEEDAMEDLKNRTYTAQAYQKVNNRTDWKELSAKILQTVGVSENAPIVFPKLRFVNALFDLLSSTPKRVQANYIFWYLYESLLKFFPKRFRQLEQNFYCQTDTSMPLKTRADFCRRLARLSFDVLPTDMLYAKEKVTEHVKDSVTELVSDIKREFVQLLKNTNWIDENSKNKAVQKINDIRGVIGQNYEFDVHDNNYEQIMNQSLLELYFQNRKALTDKLFSRINTPTYTNEFNKLANTVNAAYFTEDNVIALHAGILHDTMFNPSQMNYRNYGMLGTIIGHEIAHAISEREFWTNISDNAYQTVSRCLLDDVDRFEIQGTALKMNGTRILEENIADMVGAKASHNAYKSWVLRHGDEPTLTGLDYTQEQLFWISAVSHYCYKVDDKKIERILRGNNHALNIFRVVNPLRNNRDFASAFQCPIGSRMNPTKKCNMFGSSIV